MTTYLFRRLLLMIPTLIGITFLVFMIVASAPGGIGAAVLAQAGGAMTANSGVAQQRAYLEDRYGLNDPVVFQYVRWLGRISPVKVGSQAQQLPNGEVIRTPRPIPQPPLASWYSQGLPTLPKVEAASIKDLSVEDRVRMYRRLERQYIEGRFNTVARITEFRSALTAYARERGLNEGVNPDGTPIIEFFEGKAPDKASPQWPAVQARGEALLATYGQGLKAQAELASFFAQRPFEGYGVAVIPGVLSIAWPDFGTAFSSGRPVMELIPPALVVTLTLNLVAVPIIYLVAIPSGILAAVKRGSLFDVGIGSVYIALYSFPVVLAGVLAVGFLANQQYLGWFPVAGLHANEAAQMRFLPAYGAGGEWERGWLLDTLWHMGLPVLCLTYAGFAVLSKQTRAAMLENFNADYVRTAKAKGVSNKDVIFKHVFRNSLIPLITIFVTVFPGMLAGSVVVERIFTVPGMGSLMIEAINNRDFEVILANTVMIAVVNLAALLVADILYALADPRVGYS
jgi:ABC-type dipeptide/oligopeptide/nickel transport system permease component